MKRCEIIQIMQVKILLDERYGLTADGVNFFEFFA